MEKLNAESGAVDPDMKPNQMYGDYNCSSCHSKWQTRAILGISKECKQCHRNVYPTNLVR